MIQESQNGRSVDISYNPLGRRNQRVTASGHESLWAYDPNGLPRELTLGSDEQFQFLRNALGQETQRRVFGQPLDGWQDRPHRFARAGGR